MQADDDGPHWHWHGLLSKSRQRRRGRDVGPRTLSGRVTKTALEKLKKKNRKNGPKRHLPVTRGDCAGGPRPCPMVSCRHNLYLDVSPSGNVRLNFPDIPPEKMLISCSLDLADEGPLTLDELAQVLNLTRERVRQVQDPALAKLEVLLRAQGIDEASDGADVVFPWEATTIWG